jgi:purine-nucleoside phosphorylase
MTNSDIYEQCEEALQYLVSLLEPTGWCMSDQQYHAVHKLAIVCGSGLGQLVEGLDEVSVKVPYSNIPHFSKSQVIGHANQLIFGAVRMTSGLKLPAILMLGRLHCYEGVRPVDTVFPIILLRMLGVTHILLTNASGGVNAGFHKGDVMILRDHINMASIAGASPLVGPMLEPAKLKAVTSKFPLKGLLHSENKKEDSLTRFPNLNGIYNRSLSQLLYRAFLTQFEVGQVHAGVYFYNYGPCYESPAEIAIIRQVGADAVGMSTLPEVIMAHNLGMTLCAFALITNECTSISGTGQSWLTDSLSTQAVYQGPSHLEVMDASKQRAVKLTAAVKHFMQDFANAQESTP